MSLILNNDLVNSNKILWSYRVGTKTNMGAGYPKEPKSVVSNVCVVYKQKEKIKLVGIHLCWSVDLSPFLRCRFATS